MLWLLYYYDGKWYRLDYVYLSPFSSGLGVYIVSGSGIYNPKPQIYLYEPGLPLYVGFGLGMWFKVINIQQSPTPLLNATFVPTGNVGKGLSVIIYTQGSSVYVNISLLSGIVIPNYIHIKLYNNMKAGQSYFVNFMIGTGLLLQLAEFSIYNEQGQLLNSTVIGLPPEINGYTLILYFGSKTISNGIYQAFIVTNQNQQGANAFWDVSNITLHNGPLYNDTYLFNWTIAHNPSLNALAYWYFVWPYNNPPPQLLGIMWYWPSGKSNYPYIYYIPENGTNTYVVV
jgi:hypothetical protein